MNLFIVHMALLLGVILGLAVAFLSGGGRQRVHIASTPDASGRQRVRRVTQTPIENMIFFIIALGCMVGLYLTHFNLCTFISYWAPGTNLSALQGICGLN